MVERGILVAEDQANDAFILERAFKKTGARTKLHFVRDGQEAIDYLEGQEQFADRDAYPLPTLLLLDLKMPRLNGFQVLEWVRCQQSLRRLLVVIFSSSEEIKDINRAYDLGANSYMVKPSDFDDLLKLAEQLGKYWLVRNKRPELVLNT
jgi:CheY-like chemotaxis protein